MRLRLTVAALAAVLGCFALTGQAEAKADKAWAKSFYASNCAACHGAKGEGGVGPSLVGVKKKGDAFIKMRIAKGSPAKGMPPFESRLKADEMAALVGYMKSL